MSEISKVLAFDFGASGGRAMLFAFDGVKLSIEEMHRFSNDPVMIGEDFHWDVLRLFHEIKTGITKTLHAGHKDILSIGIDTWGVDYGLFDKKGKLLGNPYHYRDSRTEGMIEQSDKEIGNRYIFERTGIQFNFFNTLFQLMAAREDSVMPLADKLLFMPDIFNYFLTGVMKNEYTEASTSQLLHAESKTWDVELIKKAGLPSQLFCDIVEPGQVIGYLRDELCQELDCPKIPVVAVGSHDTASAVASVPVTEEYPYAYISTGTWALMGTELDKPEITDTSYQYNFTNEGGVCGKIRFLKNIMGMWIQQECKRQWEREGKSYSFKELEAEARKAAPHQSFIDPDHHSFAGPGDMPERIREFCRQTGQPVPETVGEIVCCALESLALKCRMVTEALEDVQGKKLEAIHMLGGGIQNEMFCEFVSCASRKPVLTGPVEATATGNAMMQLMALGVIDDLKTGRGIVYHSFPIREYRPENSEEWENAYRTFEQYARMS